MTEPTSGMSKRERILYQAVVPLVSALGGGLIQNTISHLSGNEKSSEAIIAIVNNNKLSMDDKTRLIDAVNAGAIGAGHALTMLASGFQLVGIGVAFALMFYAQSLRK